MDQATNQTAVESRRSDYDSTSRQPRRETSGRSSSPPVSTPSRALPADDNHDGVDLENNSNRITYSNQDHNQHHHHQQQQYYYSTPTTTSNNMMSAPYAQHDHHASNQNNNIIKPIPEKENHVEPQQQYCHHATYTKIPAATPDATSIIKRKQERLLVLYHAANCNNNNTMCKAFPQCKMMKRLWRHMKGCKSNECTVKHCFSSRVLLNHYRRCDDPTCPVCVPVREQVLYSMNAS